MSPLFSVECEPDEDVLVDRLVPIVQRLTVGRGRIIDAARIAMGGTPTGEEDLGGSVLACAVADAWAACEGPPNGLRPHVPGRLSVALDRLEAVTRASALRKVRS